MIDGVVAGPLGLNVATAAAMVDSLLLLALFCFAQPPEELVPEIPEEEDVEIVHDRRQDLIAVRFRAVALGLGLCASQGSVVAHIVCHRCAGVLCR